MQAAPKAEKSKAIGSFSIEDDRADYRIADRSTLELYATCPAQARLIETGAVMNRSHVMEVGNEVHAALSAAITDYIDSRGAMNASDIQDAAYGALLSSRPDLQPEAIRAVKASLYHWSRLIGGIHHDNILAYDGGVGARSGQLAYDFDDLKLRITSELDLLYAGPSPELLHEVDYKTGNKLHTAAMVADSFQFQLHALLVFEHWPDVQALEVKVWNTRSNRQTYRVEFTKADRGKYLYRVRQAAEFYVKHCGDIPALAPTWPTVEKCGMCPAAAICPVTDDARMLLEWDAGTFLDQTLAMQAKVDARLELMSSMVRRTKREIVSPSGNAFGAGKPRKERAPTLGFYEIKGNEEPEEID